MAVGLLDDFDVILQASENALDTGTFTPSAGSNRVVIFLVGGEDRELVGSATWGGRDLQQVFDGRANPTLGDPQASISCWLADEDDIANLVGSTFVPSFIGDNASDDGDLSQGVLWAGTLEGVDQTTPFNTPDTDGSGSSTSGLSVSITDVDDGFTLAATYAGDNVTITIGNVTEFTGSPASQGTSSGACGGVATTGTSSRTIATTYTSNAGRASLAAVSFNPAPIATTVEFSASGAAVAGASASLQRSKAFAASGSADSELSAVLTRSRGLLAAGAALSRSSVVLKRQRRFSGSATVLSGSSASTVKRVFISASGTASSGASASVFVSIAMAASDGSISGASATMTRLRRFSALGEAISNASITIFVDESGEAVTPPIPLSDAFLLNERPVIMIDLEFDSGEINLWTRPFTGEYAGKTYRPLAGLTGSLSIKQSLDRPSLDAGARIVGTADEIKNAALTEQFQLRPARVILGALDDNGDVIASEVLLSGTMQDIPLVSSPSEGLSLSVQIESVFSEISVARDLRLSAADQAGFDANDTVFDFLETATLNEPRFGA